MNIFYTSFKVERTKNTNIFVCLATTHIETEAIIENKNIEKQMRACTLIENFYDFFIR